MLIDGGNVEDSSLLYTYLKNNNISHLDYVIGTHAHEDHIGGLAGALNYATVDVAYCPATSYDSKAFGNFVKTLDKHGVSITVPTTGDSFNLGSATCSIPRLFQAVFLLCSSRSSHCFLVYEGRSRAYMSSGENL